MWKCIAGEDAGREKLAVVYIQVVREAGVREVGVREVVVREVEVREVGAMLQSDASPLLHSSFK